MCIYNKRPQKKIQCWAPAISQVHYSTQQYGKIHAHVLKHISRSSFLKFYCEIFVFCFSIFPSLTHSLTTVLYFTHDICVHTGSAFVCGYSPKSKANRKTQHTAPNRNEAKWNKEDEFQTIVRVILLIKEFGFQLHIWFDRKWCAHCIHKCTLATAKRIPNAMFPCKTSFELTKSPQLWIIWVCGAARVCLCLYCIFVLLSTLILMNKFAVAI